MKSKLDLTTKLIITEEMNIAEQSQAFEYIVTLTDIGLVDDIAAMTTDELETTLDFIFSLVTATQHAKIRRFLHDTFPERYQEAIDAELLMVIQ